MLGGLVGRTVGRRYTVVGWGDADFACSVTTLRAHDPLRAIHLVRKQQRSDWRAVAVFEGEPTLVAAWPEFLKRLKRIESRPAEIYTVVGFWVASGEAAVRTMEAGGGVVACLLFVAQLGETDVQLIGCFRGQPSLVLTSENLPPDFR